jgi:hypothetical protein
MVMHGATWRLRVALQGASMNDGTVEIFQDHGATKITLA